MKNIMAIYKWLDLAVSGIRFGPDREAVRAELAEHIEDRAADFMRIFPDMEEKEAQERALAGMGDAWELKKELARVHRPWLGYLWRATQVLVWTALALILIAALGGGADLLRDQWYQHQDAQRAWAVRRALYEDGVPDWEGERLAVFEPDVQVRLDRAALSVPRAAWWRENNKDRLYLQVRVTWDRPWEANRYIFFQLWAEDDLGNRYWQEKNTVPARGWGEQGIRTDCMNLYLDVPPEAREVHIHHKLRDGVDLAVDLTREVAP